MMPTDNNRTNLRPPTLAKLKCTLLVSSRQRRDLVLPDYTIPLKHIFRESARRTPQPRRNCGFSLHRCRRPNVDPLIPIQRSPGGVKPIFADSRTATRRLREAIISRNAGISPLRMEMRSLLACGSPEIKQSLSMMAVGRRLRRAVPTGERKGVKGRDRGRSACQNHTAIRRERFLDSAEDLMSPDRKIRGIEVKVTRKW